MPRLLLAAPLLLAALVAPAPGQTYTIKIKVAGDAGKSVTYASTNKGSGAAKAFDLDGQHLGDTPASSFNFVYTDTLLATDWNATTTRRHYETAQAAEAGGKSKPTSYHGRTLVIERKEGKARVGVVGTDELEEDDLQKLVTEANDVPLTRAILTHLAPDTAVKVGDFWKLDVKAIAAMTKEVQMDVAKSSLTVKLVEVVTRGKTQFGKFEFEGSWFIAGQKNEVVFDPPYEQRDGGTLEIAIDGSSTEYVLKAQSESTGKGKALVEKKAVALYEMGWKKEVERTCSAEADDAKARATPDVAYWNDKRQWKVFTSKEDRFSLAFPGKPKEEVKEDAEQKTAAHSIRLEPEGGPSYSVVCTTFPVTFTEKQAGELLDNLASNYEKQTQSKKAITLQGFSGVELVLEMPTEQGKAYAVARVFVVKNRAYVILAAVPAGKKELLEADKFFKSFTIEDRNEQRGQTGGRARAGAG